MTDVADVAVVKEEAAVKRLRNILTQNILTQNILTQNILTQNGFSLNTLHFLPDSPPGGMPRGRVSSILLVTALLALPIAGCGDDVPDDDASAGTSPPVQVQAPELSLSSSALDFEEVEVGTTRTLSLTVENVGNAILRVQPSLEADGEGAFTLAGPSDMNLDPTQSASLEVTFGPDVAATTTGTLLLETNDESNAAVRVGLQGVGIVPDEDGDGYGVDTDCDDTDPFTYPNAEEICDEVDNDCDLEVDENLLEPLYLDSDGDLYGVGDAVILCIGTSGYATVAGDCDDARGDIHPGVEEVCDGRDNDCDGEVDEDLSAIQYPDLDGDGYGAGEAVEICLGAPNYALNGDDCDDTSSSIHPGAQESCDELDNDCDQEVDEGVQIIFYPDTDGDGYGDTNIVYMGCEVVYGTTITPGDCNDTSSDTYPDADELCDLLDNDCDGVNDEDAVDETVWYTDGDGDGFGGTESGSDCLPPEGTSPLSGDCNDADGAYYPGADETSCTDPNDYNCDGSTGYADFDQDGFAACEDCDDTSSQVNSAAEEVCDGVDNDCDLEIDEGLTTLLYADLDLDGFGNGDAPLMSCTETLEGYTAEAGDCDDENEAVYPDAEEICDFLDNDCDGTTDEGLTIVLFTDGDADGFGDANAPVDSCTEMLEGYSSDSTDCDDQNSTVYPDASELCDGLDNDCDVSVDEDAVDMTEFFEDLDEDGYGSEMSTFSCIVPEGYTASPGDCQDLDADFYPGAPETCTDPFDYNCDGAVAYADSDADGFAACEECNDAYALAYPGATEICDETDNNCDGVIDENVQSTFYRDADGDGYGKHDAPILACEAPDGYVVDDTDCNDQNAAVNPGHDELCNGIDDDCDKSVDEANAADCTTIYQDSDGDTWGSGTSSCVCTIPLGYVTRTGDCNDHNSQIYPTATEKCNLIDDDCDVAIDEENSQGCSRYYNDKDDDGWGMATDYKCLCEQTDSYDVTTSGDCNDADAQMFPGNLEVCDEKDNNCSGSVDEGVKTTYYLDADGDGYGAPYNTKEACTAPSGYVSNGGDCNDYNSAISPGAPELCDGIDNTCNGQIDENLPKVTVYVDLDGDGHGAEGTSGKKVCLLDEDGDGVGETAPDGYSLIADDCDDSASTVYPGAPELCDGRLNNCSMTVADYQCPTVCAGSWPVAVGGSAGYPIVGQMDTDNELEVIAQNESYVRVLEHDGTVKWSVPLSVSYSYPNLADINYDNILDVIVGVHGGTTYVLNGSTGAVLTTITTSTNGGWYGSVAFDVDNDGATDLIPTGSAPYKLLLMNRNLTLKSMISLAPLSGESFTLASSALYDYEGDGIAEILLGSGSWQCGGDVSTCKGRQYIFRSDGSYYNDPTWSDSSKPWFKVVGYPYTYAGEGVWPIVADADGDGVEETSQYFTDRSGVTPSKSWIWKDDGTEHALSGSAWNTTFPVLAPIGSDGRIVSSGRLMNAGGPVIDIDNDGIYEIVSNSGGLSVTKAGQVMDGFPVKLSAGPRVIGDLNRDNRLDILFLSSSNNSVNCYTLGEGTYNDLNVLSYGTVDSLGRNWYTTGHMDPYEPNDKRGVPFVPSASVNAARDSRAFYLGPLRDTYASGNGWYRRIRALIGEKGDVDFYVMYGGMINLTLDGLPKDYDLYLHQYHPDGTYINTMSSTKTGTASEAISCHSTSGCLYTSENKTLIIEVRGKSPNVDYGPLPYRLSAVWAN